MRYTEINLSTVNLSTVNFTHVCGSKYELSMISCRYEIIYYRRSVLDNEKLNTMIAGTANSSFYQNV